MNQQLLLGIDIGGTKLGLSVGDTSGKVLVRDQIPMDRAAHPEAILLEAKRRLTSLANLAGAGDALAKIAALGAACPGPFSYSLGKFLDPPNMPAWHGFALRDWLAHHFPCPSAMMNDANATVLAEWLWGAAKGANTAAYLTMSTGMGCGLIIDGRLFEGPTGLAGEIGRLRLRDDGPVGFGKRGSVEGFLSGPGIAQLAEQEAAIALQMGESSQLVELQRAGQRLNAERVCAAAQQSDPAARRVTDRVALELGRLLAILNDILNPDVIVLGTIASAHPQLFIPQALEVLRSEGVWHSAQRTRVVTSALTHKGDQSALAVAARMLHHVRDS